MRAALLPLLLCLPAAPAAAQATEPVQAPVPTLGLPAGCVPVLSVLDASCFWTHEMTCAGDPAGTRRTVMPHGHGAYIALTDAEGQWLESVDTFDGVLWRLGENRSPMLIRELLAAGTDSFDFTQTASDGASVRIEGQDSLTGETVTIDGRELRVLEYEYTVTDASGAVTRHVRGTNHLSVEPPAYFGGVEEDLLGQSASWDTTPVDFVAHGEPGFLSAYSPDDCLAGLEAAAPADAAPAEGTVPDAAPAAPEATP